MEASNQMAMETTEVARRVARDTDDVLTTLPLVSGNDDLTDYLFQQLVDLLLEGMVVDLRRQRSTGELTSEEYRDALATLAAQCGAVGLLGRT